MRQHLVDARPESARIPPASSREHSGLRLDPRPPDGCTRRVCCRPSTGRPRCTSVSCQTSQARTRVGIRRHQRTDAKVRLELLSDERTSHCVTPWGVRHSGASWLVRAEIGGLPDLRVSGTYWGGTAGGNPGLSGPIPQFAFGHSSGFGEGTTSFWYAEHPTVRPISTTGSTSVAKSWKSSGALNEIWHFSTIAVRELT
jgi:hypothetical protein